MRAVTLSLAFLLLGVFFVSSVVSSPTANDEAKVSITPMKNGQPKACGGSCITSKQCADWGGKDCRCTLFFCVKYTKEMNQREQLLEHYRRRTPRF